MTSEKCRTCKHAFTTSKDRVYCKKSLADKDDCGKYEIITFAKFCEEILDTPLAKYQKRLCDAMEEKYRKEGNFDSCISVIRGGGPRSTLCAQLIALFSLYYLKREEK